MDNSDWAPKAQEALGWLASGLLLLSVPSVWYRVIGGPEACSADLGVFFGSQDLPQDFPSQISLKSVSCGDWFFWER